MNVQRRFFKALLVADIDLHSISQNNLLRVWGRKITLIGRPLNFCYYPAMKLRLPLCVFLPWIGLAALSSAEGILTPAASTFNKESGYLTFYLDNDVFGGQDKDYTNGFRVSWISDDRKESELGLIQRGLRIFSGDSESFDFMQKITGFDDPKKIRYNYGFSLTQLMYTPQDYEPFYQPEDQRRYAGWLGLGMSLHVKDDSVINSIELTVGTTGPNSYAEHTQDFIHDLKGSPTFNGWDNQIPNEITGDLSFVQKRRAAFLTRGDGAVTMDGLTQWGLRLGTFRTEAQIGGFFRVGYNLPSDFSDPRLSDTAYSHRYFGQDEDYTSKWSIYSLFGTMAHAVAFDATLDGPMFHSFETGNTREPFVGEVFTGIGVRYKSVEFSYVHTWRTQEYREQVSDSNFGSLAMRVRF